MANDFYPSEVREALSENVSKMKKAIQERDKAVVGMKNLTSTLETTRTSLHSSKEKNNMYELLLLRDESHIKKLKELVLSKEKENFKLKTTIRNSNVKFEDDIETDVMEQELDEGASSKENEYYMRDEASEKAVVYGVAQEIHDQLLRDYVQLKNELDDLLKKQPILPAKYMESEESKSHIAHLDSSNKELKEKVKMLEKKLKEITDVLKNDPEHNKSKVLNLTEELQSLSKKYHKQETLKLCLEEKCYDLTTELLKCKQLIKSGIKETKLIADSRDHSKVHVETEAVPMEQENNELKLRKDNLTIIQYQLKASNEKLKAAECKAQINEQRYKELLRTIKESKPEFSDECEKCKDFQRTIKKLEDDVEQQKTVNGNLSAQLTVVQEDLSHSRQDITNLKKRLEMDEWKKNYTKLSEEFKKLKDALEGQYNENKKLKLEISRNTRAPRAAMRHQPSWADYSNPGYNRPVDVCDQSSSSRNTRYDSSSQVSFQGLVTVLECPRCKREFPPSQQEELERHVARCLDD